MVKLELTTRLTRGNPSMRGDRHPLRYMAYHCVLKKSILSAFYVRGSVMEAHKIVDLGERVQISSFDLFEQVAKRPRQ